jgi:HD-like signal output (HDOD) protein
MRILLVHHDDGSPARLRSALSEAGHELVCVERYNDALARMDAEPSDAVIADATAADLDALHLMRLMRTRFPGAVRLVVVDPADREQAARSLEVAHQAVSHPLDADAIVEWTWRMQGLVRRLDSPQLLAVVGQIDRLPSAPRMYMKLRGLLGDPECHGRAVTELLDQDPGLTTKVLQLANSAYFSSGAPISGVSQAVLRIGLDAVRIAVLANEVFDAHRGADVASLRRRAVRASQLAARMAPAECRDLARTAALLAYVGLLVPGIEALCAAEAARSDAPPTPADVGAYLLSLWGLPAAIVEAVAHHREPSRVARTRLDVLGLVHMAVSLTDATEPDGDYLQAVGADRRWTEWQELAQAMPEQDDI